MKHTLIKTAILAAVLGLGACSSVPTTTPLLDQARGDFVAANNNSRVATFAPLEFKQASEALEQANAAAARKDSLEQIDKLAYLAKQKIATAQEVAKQKQAEADIAASGKERDAVRLEARTAEADRAKMDAAAAQAAAARAAADAAAAQNQAAAAQGQVAAAEAQTREAQARAAQLEALMTDLQAKKTERGLIITIGDVLFGVDQANLTANGQATLRKLADALAQNPNRTVLVEGFTDSTGSTAHNQQLSEKRAASVRAALVEMGVARDRVAMRAYGEAFPVAPNDNAGNRQLNRRVEIVLSNENAAIAPRR
ncbi:OmpA family protein [Massilia atriviolacea]|uniref:OmpA family protein n=1 Tax=Massilia atriviolacea TaxID=2495579 RepID=A0A430HIR2_9BURK|nr:OmpA family protein [Massilia atriviolacea]RSZ57391.1 OmpA family protein [Massilia atriviolacea]